MNRHFCLRQKANEIIKMAQNDNSLDVEIIKEGKLIWTIIKDQDDNCIFDLMDVPSDDVMLFQFNLDPRSRYIYYSKECKTHKFSVSYSGYPITSRQFYYSLKIFMNNLQQHIIKSPNTMGSLI